ncbi:Defensin-like protein [Gossypium arboreum]|uniref:Defensin-like protein n=1 Tax=Gossypium arboreum TaxID=29729 RepID=A0A0B0NFN0_GOSAR|nr:Defensin-like protein [Gossypium arboreum]
MGKEYVRNYHQEVGTCKCLYECDSNTDRNGKSRPENKKCSVGIGPCSVKCNDICCRFKCAFKYPGPLEGTGMCLNIIGPLH